MKNPPPSVPIVSPLDAIQVSSADTVAILVSSFNPPVSEYLTVLKALSGLRGIKQAWMAPAHGGKDVVHACNVLAAMLATQGVQVGVCSLGADAGLSFPDDVFEACKGKLKYLKLKMAYVASEYPGRNPSDDEVVVIPRGFDAKPCKCFISEKFPLVRNQVNGSLLDFVKKSSGCK